MYIIKILNVPIKLKDYVKFEKNVYLIIVL